MAARLRRELNEDVDVIGGPYGQFHVLTDGVIVLDAGPLAALGVLPSARTVLDAVRASLAQGSTLGAVDEEVRDSYPARTSQRSP